MLGDGAGVCRPNPPMCLFIALELRVAFTFLNYSIFNEYKSLDFALMCKTSNIYYLTPKEKAGLGAGV